MQDFQETEINKDSKQMEQVQLKIFNCPYINTYMFECHYCKEYHRKPKSYTGNVFSQDKEQTKTMGIRLKRRDIPQILKSFGVEITKD